MRLIFEQPELSDKELDLLFLMPLVQTAWEHGAIARGEKQAIFTAARADGIDERDPLNDTLDELLVYRPSREFFEDCLAIIARRLVAMTVAERTARREKLLERCRAVAASAGGRSPMDIDHHISPEERSLLEYLETAL